MKWIPAALTVIFLLILMIVDTCKTSTHKTERVDKAEETVVANCWKPILKAIEKNEMTLANNWFCLCSEVGGAKFQNKCTSSQAAAVYRGRVLDCLQATAKKEIVFRNGVKTIIRPKFKMKDCLDGKGSRRF